MKQEINEAIRCWESIAEKVSVLNRLYEKADLNAVQPNDVCAVIPASLDEWLERIYSHIDAWNGVLGKDKDVLLNYDSVTHISRALVDAGFYDCSYINDELASITTEKTKDIVVYVAPDDCSAPIYLFSVVDFSKDSATIFETNDEKALIAFIKTIEHKRI